MNLSQAVGLLVIFYAEEAIYHSFFLLEHRACVLGGFYMYCADDECNKGINGVVCHDVVVSCLYSLCLFLEFGITPAHVFTYWKFFGVAEKIDWQYLALIPGNR